MIATFRVYDADFPSTTTVMHPKDEPTPTAAASSLSGVLGIEPRANGSTLSVKVAPLAPATNPALPTTVVWANTVSDDSPSSSSNGVRAFAEDLARQALASSGGGGGDGDGCQTLDARIGQDAPGRGIDVKRTASYRHELEPRPVRREHRHLPLPGRPLADGPSGRRRDAFGSGHGPGRSWHPPARQKRDAYLA